MSEPYQPPSQQPESGQPYPQSGQPQQGYQQGQPSPQYPGQQYPGQQYPSQQHYPGQQYPGQPQYPGQQQYPPPQGYPQQAYPGQYPGSGFPGQGQPAAKTPIPTTVTAAFGVYLLAAALSLVGMILALNSDIWDLAVREAGSQQDLGGVSPESVVAVAKGFVIAVGLIFLGLYLLFAFKMRAGRNWARITLTVLSALSLLSTANASASFTLNDRTYTSTSSTMTGWIGAALSLAAIVLMYLPASNEYFRTVKARLMQQKLQQYQS